MLPRDNYLSRWIGAQQEFYPEYGFQVGVYTGPIILSDSMAQEGPGRVLKSVNTWWGPFKQFLTDRRNMTWDQVTDNITFQHLAVRLPV